MASLTRLTPLARIRGTVSSSIRRAARLLFRVVPGARRVGRVSRDAVQTLNAVPVQVQQVHDSLATRIDGVHGQIVGSLGVVHGDLVRHLSNLHAGLNELPERQAQVATAELLKWHQLLTEDLQYLHAVVRELHDHHAEAYRIIVGHLRDGGRAQAEQAARLDALTAAVRALAERN